MMERHHTCCGTKRQTMDSVSNSGHSGEGWSPADDHDRYTASIELSNKCREFYNSRLEAANSMRARWYPRGQRNLDGSTSGSEHTRIFSSSSSSSASSMSSSSLSSSSSSSSTSSNENVKSGRDRPQRPTIELAMDKLRTEMLSLMDQDLSLMRQLLTLNEAIEDLKAQRSFCSSWTSMSNSRNLDSDWSVSDTEMYGSDTDLTMDKTLNDDWSQSAACSIRTEKSRESTSTTGKDESKNRDDRISLSSLTQQINNMSILNSTFQTDGHTAQKLTEKIRDNTSSERKFGDCNTHCAKYDTHAPRPVTIHHDREQNSFDSGIHDLTTCEDDHIEWTV